MEHHHASQASKEGAALGSVVASFGLMAMKFVVGIATGSIGILSEAAHSLLDFFAAGLTYYSVRLSARPVDDDHHYGHGKVESVSALIETGLLFLTSAWVVYEAVTRLISGSETVQVTWYAFAVISASIAVDFFRARRLMKVARETGSQALEADALHFSSDILSSIVVLFGLIAVAYGYEQADAFAAIGVALFIVKVGWNLGKRTIDVLIDAAPEGVADRVRQALNGVAGIVRIERIRARYAGPSVLIDVVADVDRTSHAESIRMTGIESETRIVEAIPGADVVMHLKPVALSSETLSEQVYAIAGRYGLLVHDVIADIGHDGERHISLDVAVDDTLTVDEAHAIASQLEQHVREELGESSVVVAHIDPVNRMLLQSVPASAEEIERSEKTIRSLAENILGLTDVHRIACRMLDNGDKFLSLHVIVAGDMSLKKAHAHAETLEGDIRRALPDIDYVKIHVESSCDERES